MRHEQLFQPTEQETGQAPALITKEGMETGAMAKISG